MSNQISLGIYLGFLGLMLMLMPIALIMAAAMAGMLALMFFFLGARLVWITAGEIKIIEIKHWPTVRGRRVAPLLLVVLGFLYYQYWHFGIGSMLTNLVWIALIFGILFLDKSKKSPAAALAERLERPMSTWLQRRYYRKPKIFPTLFLVD